MHRFRIVGAVVIFVFGITYFYWPQTSKQAAKPSIYANKSTVITEGHNYFDKRLPPSSQTRGLISFGRNISSEVCQSSAPIIDAQGNPSYASTDGSHVFSFSTAGDCNIVPRASPNTFVALDSNYGKDSNSVWVIGGTSDSDTDLVTGQISGADPATFALMPDPTGREGYSDDYTKDKNNVYYDGQIIAGAIVSTFVALHGLTTISIGSTTRECIFDAESSETHYYFGEPIDADSCFSE